MRRSLTVPASFAAAFAIACGGLAFAAEKADDKAASSVKEALKSARTDSLELPGVTACHTCEWWPMKTEMQTDRCANQIGIFDCGRGTDCEKKCEFVKCSD